MTYSEPSPTLRAILRDLEERERRRPLTFREIEQRERADRLLESVRRAYFSEEPAT